MSNRIPLYAALLMVVVSCTPRSYLLDAGDLAKATYSSANAVPTPTPAPQEVKKEVVPVIDYSKDIAITPYDPFEEAGVNELFLNLNDMGSEFEYPIYGEYSSRCGLRGGRMHDGIDITAPADSPIYAAFEGTVRLCKDYGDYGNTIVITHDNGLETVYAHNSVNLVSVGDEVMAGDKIARCGMTGNATGSHLHFEVRVCGETIDPELILDTQSEWLQSGTLTISKDKKGKITASLEKDEEAAVETTDTSPNSSNGILIGGKVYENPTPPTPEPEKKYHTVVRGDTLSQIAEKYNTPLSKIYSLNNMNSNSVIKVGQKIRIQ